MNLYVTGPFGKIRLALRPPATMIAKSVSYYDLNRSATMLAMFVSFVLILVYLASISTPKLPATLHYILFIRFTCSKIENFASISYSKISEMNTLSATNILQFFSL